MSDSDGDEAVAEAQREDGDEAWDDWEGGEGEEDEEPTKSLFDDQVLPSAEAALQHDVVQHGFDLRQYAMQVRQRPFVQEKHVQAL